MKTKSPAKEDNTVPYFGILGFVILFVGVVGIIIYVLNGDVENLFRDFLPEIAGIFTTVFLMTAIQNRKEKLDKEKLELIEKENPELINSLIKELNKSEKIFFENEDRVKTTTHE